MPLRKVNWSSPSRTLEGLKRLFLCASLWVWQCSPLQALDLNVELEWESAQQQNRGTYTGVATFSGLKTNQAICFVVPFNDVNYRRRNRATSRFGEAFSRQPPVDRKAYLTIVQPRDGQILTNGSTMIRLNQIDAEGIVKINFRSSFPLPSKDQENNIVLDGLFPKLLTSCPSSITQSTERIEVETTISLNKPKNLNIFSNGLQSITHRVKQLFKRHDQDLVILMTPDQPKRLTFNRLGVHVFGTGAEDKLGTVRKAYIEYENLLGPTPESKLHIVETKDPQRANIPGMLFIHTPRQSLFSKAQTKYSNWQQWQIFNNLSAQWFGAWQRPVSTKYQWLNFGAADFFSGLALESSGEPFNLFKEIGLPFLNLELSYKEFQNTGAAIIQRSGFNTPLVNANWQSLLHTDEAHSAIFLRHTLALRDIFNQIGREDFTKWAKACLISRAERAQQPLQLLKCSKQANQISPAKQQRIVDALTYWWQSNAWPDFVLRKYESLKKETHFESRAIVDFIDSEPRALGVLFTDSEGKKHLGHTQWNDTSSSWTATASTTSPVSQATVDADRAYYDRNRFNNTFAFPSVSFFPGNAKKLSDDGYTVVWVPYPVKRPGEPFALGIQSGILRYFHQASRLGIEYFPSEISMSGTFSHVYQRPSAYWNLGIGLSQDRLRRRTMSGQFNYPDLFGEHYIMGASLKSSLKQDVGTEGTNHATWGLELSLKTRARSSWLWHSLNFNVESTLPAQDQDFQYARLSGIYLVDSKLTQLIRASLRYFAGNLFFDGDVPYVALFRPQDVAESRLRIDVADREAPAETSFRSLNLDLNGPLRIGLSDQSILLSRQLRWRVFYDLGSQDWDTVSYRNFGAGLLSSFGGDFSGVGPLALTQMSLVAILYKSTPHTVDFKPSFLIDFSGSL